MVNAEVLDYIVKDPEVKASQDRLTLALADLHQTVVKKFDELKEKTK